jgi:hypothetical protein
MAPVRYYAMRDDEEQVTGGNRNYEFRPARRRSHRRRYTGTSSTTTRGPGGIGPASLVMQPATRLKTATPNSTRGNGTISGLPPIRAPGIHRFENVSPPRLRKLETSNDESALKRVFSYGPEPRGQRYIQYENFNFLALSELLAGIRQSLQPGVLGELEIPADVDGWNPFRSGMAVQLSAYNDPRRREESWYFGTRCQFTCPRADGPQYDTYTRKADGADLKRLSLRAEYRPVFPVRFRIRHRISGRHDQRPDDIRAFQSWDTRLEMRVNLSNYDQMGFLYSTTNVTFADRPRLSAPADGGNTSTNQVGSRGIPAKAVQGRSRTTSAISSPRPYRRKSTTASCTTSRTTSLSCSTETAFGTGS